ncbi:DUF2199 domain-containing protein [Streptomyces goshikiensis]|uniref:DUF2199 domain-containing protein n=1 Tax=Streptomyces goshikiensis TaxID=1942 RepID=UPI00371BE8B2
MTSDLGFTCSCCGAHHPELPMNYTAEAPFVWDPTFADADDCLLSSDQCVIQAEHYRPLAVEQRTGITPDRVRDIAAAVRHPSRGKRQQ